MIRVKALCCFGLAKINKKRESVLYFPIFMCMTVFVFLYIESISE